MTLIITFFTLIVAGWLGRPHKGREALDTWSRKNVTLTVILRDGACVSEHLFRQDVE